MSIFWYNKRQAAVIVNAWHTIRARKGEHMKDWFQPESGIIRFLTRIMDLLVLNILLDFLCLTIVLSGASITALYFVTLKMIEEGENVIIKNFFRGIRENFIASFPTTLLLFVDVLLVAICHYALFAETLVFSPFLFIALVIAVILLTALLSYLFPLTARFENTFPRHLGNAVRLALAHLPVTFFITAVHLLPCVSLFLFPRCGYLVAFWLMIGLAAGAYLNSFYLSRIFDKINHS